MAPSPERIRVRVIYACADRQTQVEVLLESGMSVADALRKSGLVERFAELRSGALRCAIFGRVVDDASVVRDGDRVEILRPLIADPKENRRQAAARARQDRAAPFSKR